MESIDKCVLMRIIIPSASDGSPDALSQDLEGLGPHFCPYIGLIVSQQHGSRSIRLQLSSFVRVKFYYAGGCWLQLATDSHLVVGHQRQLGGLPAVLQTRLLLSRQSRGRGSVCGKQHSTVCNPMTSGGGGVCGWGTRTRSGPRPTGSQLTAHNQPPPSTRGDTIPLHSAPYRRNQRSYRSSSIFGRNIHSLLSARGLGLIQRKKTKYVQQILFLLTALT